MAKITTIGLDLAKQVFHVVCCDAQGKMVRKRMLRRAQVGAYFAQLEAALVGMEACSSAHNWARELQALGHTVKLLPPQFVKAYVRGNKNDYNDAVAIAEAVVRQAAHKDNRLSRWINKIRAQRGYNTASVTLANKLTRIGWAVLYNRSVYQAA